MAGILIFILKLIGWILLSLIILLFVALALVLILPIPYRLRLLAKEGEPPVFTARVFGFQVFPKREGKQKKKQPGKKADEPKTEAPDKPEPNDDEPPEAKKAPEPAAEPEVNPKQEADAAPKSGKEKKRRQKKAAKKPRERGVKRQALARIRGELADEGNHRALSHVLSEAVYLLRHFGPRKVKGELSFSLGDPANTGYATAALSVCPFAYEGCRIYPDFASEKMYVAGELEVRGHVRLVHALRSGLGLLLDKDIRKLIHKVRK